MRARQRVWGVSGGHSIGKLLSVCELEITEGVEDGHSIEELLVDGIGGIAYWTDGHAKTNRKPDLE